MHIHTIDRKETYRQAPSRAGSPAEVLVDGYDRLSVRQIGRQLNFLLASEIRLLRDYERAHKHRKTLLRMIDRRLATRE